MRSSERQNLDECNELKINKASRYLTVYLHQLLIVALSVTLKLTCGPISSLSHQPHLNFFQNFFPKSPAKRVDWKTNHSHSNCSDHVGTMKRKVAALEKIDADL